MFPTGWGNEVPIAAGKRLFCVSTLRLQTSEATTASSRHWQGQILSANCGRALAAEMAMIEWLGVASKG